MNPRYPIYIITKGRWESRLTSKELDRLSVPYVLVVEPQELDKYLAEVPSEKVLVCPENFSERKQGSIPVRNFVWENSIEAGADWHWIMDDNIKAFWRCNNNLRIRVADGTIFWAAEEFVNRYENIGQAGFQYYMFCPDMMILPAFVTNTRVYSCILNNNQLPHRWRGRYNEDTDLSIRILKDGLCTVLFNAFLAQKATTGTVKGGNMEQLYGGNDQLGDSKGKEWIEKRRLMAQSLIDQHPDIATMSWKWDRPQHQVNYNGFKQKLIRKSDWNYSGVNNFGMEIIQIRDADAKREPLAPSKKSPKKSKAPAPKKTEKEFAQDYWADRGFCGTQKLTDSIKI